MGEATGRSPTGDAPGVGVDDLLIPAVTLGAAGIELGVGPEGPALGDAPGGILTGDGLCDPWEDVGTAPFEGEDTEDGGENGVGGLGVGELGTSSPTHSPFSHTPPAQPQTPPQLSSAQTLPKPHTGIHSISHEPSDRRAKSKLPYPP